MAVMFNGIVVVTVKGSLLLPPIEIWGFLFPTLKLMALFELETVVPVWVVCCVLVEMVVVPEEELVLQLANGFCGKHQIFVAADEIGVKK